LLQKWVVPIDIVLADELGLARNASIELAWDGDQISDQNETGGPHFLAENFSTVGAGIWI